MRSCTTEGIDVTASVSSDVSEPTASPYYMTIIQTKNDS